MDMKNYKDELNNIHAPEDLIKRTLEKVHEEQASIEAEEANSRINETYGRINETNSSQIGDNVPESGKVSFFEKYRKYIVAGSSLAAAALVLILAVNVIRLNKNSSSTMSETYQADNAFSEESADDMEEFADESDMAAEETADDSDMAAAETAESMDEAFESEETAEADDSDGGIGYYNLLASSEEADKISLVIPEETSDANTFTEDTLDGESMKYKSDGKGEREDTGNMSQDDYSELTGINLETLFKEVTVKSENIYTKMDDTGKSLEDDYARFDIESSGKTVVSVSKSRTLAPEDLLSGKSSNIEGYTVYLGKSDSNDSYVAAFDINGIHLLLNSEKVTQDEFETYLMQLLNYK